MSSMTLNLPVLLFDDIDPKIAFFSWYLNVTNDIWSTCIVGGLDDIIQFAAKFIIILGARHIAFFA